VKQTNWSCQTQKESYTRPNLIFGQMQIEILICVYACLWAGALYLRIRIDTHAHCAKLWRISVAL